ncbi:MAG: hypothetical protein JO057_28830 [Chloroflexi bacterium]|nr:hypothetical protein [Chloroflexota bacterium]
MNFEPRTQDDTTVARDQAYRRLAAVILRLDVATLARELQAARLQAEYSLGDFAHAA